MKSPLSLNTGTVDILLVDLPEGIISCNVLHEEGYNPVLDIFISYGCSNLPEKAIELPPGNWIELGFSDELTEEQAKGLGFESLKEFIEWLAKNNQRSRKYILVKIK